MPFPCAGKQQPLASAQKAGSSKRPLCTSVAHQQYCLAPLPFAHWSHCRGKQGVLFLVSAKHQEESWLVCKEKDQGRNLLFTGVGKKIKEIDFLLLPSTPICTNSRTAVCVCVCFWHLHASPSGPVRLAGLSHCCQALLGAAHHCRAGEVSSASALFLRVIGSGCSLFCCLHPPAPIFDVLWVLSC